MLDRFEALSNEFRYQQRPMGAPCPDLHVAQEVANNVSANENRIPNTTEREEAEVGQYLIMGSLHARSDRGIGLPV